MNIEVKIESEKGESHVYLKSLYAEHVHMGEVVSEAERIENPVYCEMIAGRVTNLADCTTEMDISGDNRSVAAGVLTDDPNVRVIIAYNSLVSTAGSQYIMDTYPEDEQDEFAFFSGGVMGDEYEYLIGAVSETSGTKSVFRGACQFGGGDAAATLANLAYNVMFGEAGVDYGKSNPNSIGLYFPIDAELNGGNAALVCFDTSPHIESFTYEEVLARENLMVYWDEQNESFPARTQKAGELVLEARDLTGNSAFAEKYRGELRIKVPGVKQMVVNLSGGNQQKVALAKALAADPDIIIFDEPTKGIDVGAKQEIYQLMNDLVESGKAIIMVLLETTLPFWVVWPVCIVLGFLMGTLNGLIASKLKLFPLVVTIATSEVFKGIAYTITSSKSYSGMPDAFRALYKTKLLGLPLDVYLAILVVAATWIVLNKTHFGRDVLAVGGNKECARLSGIRSDLVQTLCFALTGAIFAIATLDMLAQQNQTSATTGPGTEITCLTAAIIGGISMMGGKGNVVGMVAGIFVMQMIANGMQLAGWGTYTQYIVKGVILLLAIGFDAIKNYPKPVVRIHKDKVGAGKAS